MVLMCHVEIHIICGQGALVLFFFFFAFMLDPVDDGACPGPTNKTRCFYNVEKGLRLVVTP